MRTPRRRARGPAWAAGCRRARARRARPRRPRRGSARFTRGRASACELEMERHDLRSCKSVAAAVCGALARAPPSAGTRRVLDAGGGSGLLGSWLARALSPMKVAIPGGDLTREMLDEAQKTGCYEALVAVDLDEDCSKVLTSAVVFHLFIGSGLLMPGHCAVGAFAYLLRLVASGGHAAFTIRESLYTPDKREYLNAVEAERCTLIRNRLEPYYGENAAHVVVIRKC